MSASIYKWVIVAASFVSHVIIYGISWTTGIFYEIFRDEFDSGSSVASLMTSLNTALLYGAGPLSGLLTNRFGHRPVAIAGSVITMTGLTLSALAQSSYYLIFTFGIVSGFGLGLSYIPFVSIIGPLFEGGRFLGLALGFAACGVGIGTLVFPPILRLLIDLYSWKGALLIAGGISLNLCVTGALLRPIEKPAEAPTKSALSDLFRCHVFRNHLYVTLCANSLFLCFSLSIVYVHLAAYAHSRGCNPQTSALLYSVVGGATCVGRIVFGLLASQSRVRSVYLYMLAMALCGLVVLLCPLAVDYAGLVAFAAFFGFLSSAIGPLIPKIAIDCVGSGSLSSAFGYLLSFEALGQLIGAPAAGWLYDSTQSYTSSFLMAGGSLFLSVIVMSNWFCQGRQINDAKPEVDEAGTRKVSTVTPAETIEAWSK